MRSRADAERLRKMPKSGGASAVVPSGARPESTPYRPRAMGNQKMFTGRKGGEDIGVLALLEQDEQNSMVCLGFLFDFGYPAYACVWISSIPGT